MCGLLHCFRLKVEQGLLRHQAHDFCVPSKAASQSHESHAEIFERGLKTDCFFGERITSPAICHPELHRHRALGNTF